MFRDVEHKFRDVEYKFKNVEYRFNIVEHNFLLGIEIMDCGSLLSLCAFLLK